MTAIAVIKQRESVHLLTDGGNFDVTGRVLALSSKAWPLPHLNMAIAVRGPMLIAPMLAHIANCAGNTYEAVKARLVDLAREWYDLQIDFMNALPSRHFDVVVAGISNAGADAYMFSSASGSGLEPWKLTNFGAAVFAMPISAQLLAELQVEFPDGIRSDLLHPVRDGIRILEAQRRCTFDTGTDDGSARGAGGFIQLTTVRRNTISTSVVHRWFDDLVGDDMHSADLRSVIDMHALGRPSA